MVSEDKDRTMKVKYYKTEVRMKFLDEYIKTIRTKLEELNNILADNGIDAEDWNEYRHNDNHNKAWVLEKVGERYPDYKSILALCEQQRGDKRMIRRGGSVQITLKEWYDDKPRKKNILPRDWWLLVEEEQRTRCNIFFPEVYVGELVDFPVIVQDSLDHKVLRLGDQIEEGRITEEESGKYVKVPSDFGYTKIDKEVACREPKDRHNINDLYDYTKLRQNAMHLIRRDSVAFRDLMHSYFDEEDLRTPYIHSRMWKNRERDDIKTSFAVVEFIRCQGMGEIPKFVLYELQKSSACFLLYPQVTLREREGKWKILDVYGRSHLVRFPKKASQETIAKRLNKQSDKSPKGHRESIPYNNLARKNNPLPKDADDGNGDLSKKKKDVNTETPVEGEDGDSNSDPKGFRYYSRDDWYEDDGDSWHEDDGDPWHERYEAPSVRGTASDQSLDGKSPTPKPLSTKRSASQSSVSKPSGSQPPAPQSLTTQTRYTDMAGCGNCHALQGQVECLNNKIQIMNLAYGNDPDGECVTCEYLKTRVIASSALLVDKNTEIVNLNAALDDEKSRKDQQVVHDDGGKAAQEWIKENGILTGKLEIKEEQTKDLKSEVKELSAKVAGLSATVTELRTEKRKTETELKKATKRIKTLQAGRHAKDATNKPPRRSASDRIFNTGALSVDLYLSSASEND